MMSDHPLSRRKRLAAAHARARQAESERHPAAATRLFGVGQRVIAAGGQPGTVVRLSQDTAGIRRAIVRRDDGRADTVRIDRLRRADQ